MEYKWSLLRQVSKYSAIGLEMALSVVIGLAIGWWLDRLFGTKPWLSLIFLLFGLIAGFRSLYRLLRDIKKNGGIDQE